MERAIGRCMSGVSEVVKNMRKYKFRVWDKKGRKMIYLSPNDTILFKNGKCTVWKENQYDETEECFCCKTFSDVIPMLCLGRMDKNKEEIYEGDILRFTHEREDFINTDVRIAVEIPKIYYMIDNPYNHSFERIGNIYENPELLKEEREVEHNA